MKIRPPPITPSTYLADHPDRPAVITASGEVVTFAELEARSANWPKPSPPMA